MLKPEYNLILASHILTLIFWLDLNFILLELDVFNKLYNIFLILFIFYSFPKCAYKK